MARLDNSNKKQKLTKKKSTAKSKSVDVLFGNGGTARMNRSRRLPTDAR